MTSLNDILKGKEEISITQKDNQQNQKKEKKDNENNVNLKDIYTEALKESPGNNQMLSDILNPSKEESKKKEVKFKEESKQDEKKGKIEEDQKKLRFSKRLEQAKKQRQINEEKNKFRKSEAITQKAEALEKKITKDN